MFDGRAELCSTCRILRLHGVRHPKLGSKTTKKEFAYLHWGWPKRRDDAARKETARKEMNTRISIRVGRKRGIVHRKKG